MCRKGTNFASDKRQIHIKMKHKYLIGLLLGCYLSGYSQTENELEEIIIEDNRLQIPFDQLTRNIQVITKQEIQKMPVSSLNEVLSSIGGVDIRQRGPFGSQADVSIDGGTFEQTMILWNGVKVGDAQTAHHSLNLPIPLDAIERIEILKGPAARIYSVNALTGAINIVTKTVDSDYLELHTYAGSSFKDKAPGDGDGIYASGGLQATLTKKTGKVQHLLSIGKEETNGQRYNTAAKNLKLMYQGSAAINDKNSLEWMSGYIDNEFGANGYYAAPHDLESYELVKTLLLSIGSTHQISDQFTFKPRISNRYNEDDYRFYRHDLNTARSLHYSNSLMIELNGNYKTKHGLFGLGYGLQVEEVNSSNLGAHDRANHGWFAEYKPTIWDDLLINVGAYWNYNSAYGFQWYPGIDVAYLLHPDWKASVNVGRSQRIPSFTDLYIDQRPGNIGNPDLQSETAWQYEAGINYNGLNSSFHLSAFQRNIDQFIDFMRWTSDDPYQPQNLGSQVMRGIHVRWNQQVELATNQNLSYKLSYQYLSPKQGKQPEGVISKYVIESLKHQVILGLNYQYNQWGAQLQNRYIKREKNEGYFVTDLRIFHNFSRFQIYAQATNLFDTKYKEIAAVPMPTRWLQLGLKYRLKIANQKG